MNDRKKYLKNKNKVTSLALPPDIPAFCKAKNINLSELARDLLDDYLRLNWPEYLKRSEQAKK